MKFTLSWLRDHLDTEASLDEITTALTRIGLEVEGVLDRAATLAPFTVAHVLEAVPHPNADKLRVCKVDTGAGVLQVVCGAPNARTGLKVVFAASGTTIPDSGLTLKPTKIRDVESNGMLVSEREMGISAESEGIIEMPEDAPVGQPFAPLMGLDDPVIEIAVTPNRADCLGIHGIARDLAAAGLGTLKTPAIAKPPATGEAAPARIDLGADTHLCPLFSLTRISGVNNGPAPEWMQRRLRAVSLRPINALVDVTNYITIDRGRPLHVFDAAKVRGPLTVRRARAGEVLAALDGREYKLDESMVVIADDAGVQALAGIMGGAATGCDENTRDVIVEAALWNAGNVAQTGRRLGLHSDARHRFERGVDPAFARPGLALATGMILDLCGGTATAQAIAGSEAYTGITIDFPITEVKRLTGIAASPAEIQNALKALGFAVTDEGERLLVSPPSWRADVEGKADLVEEVMRMLGLERITVTPLPALDHLQSPILTLLQRRTRTARRALAARGLMEAVTWSFLSKREAEAFGGGADELALANPIAADLSDMRPSLLPGLLAAAQKNADRGFADVALFEVGQVFRGVRAEDQKTAAALVRRGTAKPEGAGRHWSSPASAVDVFDAKADALALLAALGVPTANVQVVPGGVPWLHPGRSGTLQLGPQVVLGTFGELHPRALKALGVEGPLAVAEIILDALPAPKAKPTRAKPALERSDLQPLSRDFAFVVGSTVRAADILRAAQAAERTLITGAEIFDIYEGTGVPEGKKSVAVGITLQPRGKTMTDAEIEAVAAKVVAQVGKVTGGVLRQ